MVDTGVAAIWPLLITLADTILVGTRVVPPEGRLAKVPSMLTSVWLTATALLCLHLLTISKPS